MDGEAVHDQIAAVQDLYEVFAGGATVLALDTGLRRKLQSTEAGTTLGASHIALFHSVPPAQISVKSFVRLAAELSTPGVHVAAIRVALRSTCSPCHPTIGKAVPLTPAWLHEIKYDGYRLIVAHDGDRLRLFTRNGARLDQPLPVDRRERAEEPQQFVIDGTGSARPCA